MDEPSLEMKAGFLPYGDGSGHQVTVRIVESPGEGYMLSIETGYRFDVSKWHEVRDGIERLLRAVGN